MTPSTTCSRRLRAPRCRTPSAISSGYGAAYYTYRWSIVIADDLFTAFQKNGLRDRATAERYRTLVLAPGGSKPAAELVTDFLGRPITLDAYKAKLAKDQ